MMDWLTARPFAHRGLHDMNKSRWENTPSAFQAAIDAGYGIECDVHLTADGEVMVFHDKDLKRLTGQDGEVHEKTAAEMAALSIGGTADRPQTLTEMLAQVDGRVPLLIELKGIRGHDDGLVQAVGKALAAYRGPAAIMSFDHWLIRDFAKFAPGIPAGLTACGKGVKDLENHFSMLSHGISFTSFAVNELPNLFTDFVRARLGMPVLTWTVRDPKGVAQTMAHADQMTFEGFLP